MSTSPPADPAILPTVEVEVTAHRIEEYAASIGDANPRFRRQGRDATSVVAPPTFGAAYIQEPLRVLARDRAHATALGIDFRRVVFGEVEYRYHGLVPAGAWVRCSGQLLDRRTSGDKEIIRFATTAYLDDGSLATEATITLVRQ